MKTKLLLAAFLVSVVPAKATGSWPEVKAKWDTCVGNAVYLFTQRLSSEPADVIVMGAYGECEPQLVTLLAELFQNTNMDVNTIMSSVRNFEDGDRNRYVSVVLHQRMGIIPK